MAPAPLQVAVVEHRHPLGGAQDRWLITWLTTPSKPLRHGVLVGDDQILDAGAGHRNRGGVRFIEEQQGVLADDWLGS